jgi:hypothetical protein|tara:strand:- start:305 stop:670 length:366 start_codon:yes stop_codon:yes gene_type:complete
MPRKPSRKTLVKNLDKAVSEYIRKRDKYCVQCGTSHRLTNGHVFTRKNYSTRFDISDDGNCHCQCTSCNFKHTFDQWEYFKWYIDKFGQEKFDELRRRHKTLQQFKNHDLEELLEEIKNEL